MREDTSPGLIPGSRHLGSGRDQGGHAGPFPGPALPGRLLRATSHLSVQCSLGAWPLGCPRLLPPKLMGLCLHLSGDSGLLPETDIVVCSPASSPLILGFLRASILSGHCLVSEPLLLLSNGS